MTDQLKKEIPEYEQEAWGGWKIVSDMLDHPDENGIYQTSKCYKELYDFVVRYAEAKVKEARKDHNLAMYHVGVEDERERIVKILEGMKIPWSDNWNPSDPSGWRDKKWLKYRDFVNEIIYIILEEYRNSDAIAQITQKE